MPGNVLINRTNWRMAVAGSPAVSHAAQNGRWPAIFEIVPAIEAVFAISGAVGGRTVRVVGTVLPSSGWWIST